MLDKDNDVNKLTVVIPTYGRAEKILKSIHSCQHPDISIVVIDDNGLDTPNQVSTKALIDNVAPEFNGRLLYYALNDNSGACIARNKGIELTKSSIVTFLDDDDMLLVEATLAKLQFFNEHSEYDICCSDMYSKFNGKKYQLDFCHFKGTTPIELLEDGNCYTPMVMGRKKALMQIGGFDNCKKYQDHVLILKIHLSKLSVLFFKQPTFIHVDHDEYRISNTPCSYQTVKLRFEYEEKLLNSLNLDDAEYQRLKAIILYRKKYLCFYYIVMPRLNSFKKRFIGTKRFLYSIEQDGNAIFINGKSFFYALKTVTGLPLLIKRMAYKIKHSN
ncbi:glycosyltransferase family 2 protein [Shewanella sp. 6_MG-2023]|uniref:glycosyltransferase family 2 protein n=1 Tax=Shewanella sp. 6_MG-2023 TaxID=3062660 RepID=UPI0026E3352B|nr:glycosyltransferase family 2 protein [Shewanella sp. 6_MG-2023]MDO6619791.1 glycosyltransferase family 2 protein [Shewanella sp. 6_MG-2023]